MRNLLFTNHAERRCAQRGIDTAHIELTLNYGKTLHRQGLIFHIMRSKDLPPKLDAHSRGRAKNLVVVTPVDDPAMVITAYRSASALRNIKRKGKTLL